MADEKCFEGTHTWIGNRCRDCAKPIPNFGDALKMVFALRSQIEKLEAGKAMLRDGLVRRQWSQSTPYEYDHALCEDCGNDEPLGHKPDCETGKALSSGSWAWLAERYQKLDAEALERVAAFCHSQWSGWVRYLFSKSSYVGDGDCLIPRELAHRWWRQMSLDYKNLSEGEREKDRKEVRGFFAALAEQGGKRWLTKQ